MTLLFDLGAVPPQQCDDCIEDLFKAHAQNSDGDLDATMWRPLENPWLRDHCEDVTAIFTRIVAALQDAFARALTGDGMTELKKAAPPWLRWDEGQFEAAHAHLEGKPPSEYTLDDWMLFVEWIINRFLPDGVINNLADYITIRAQLLGKVEANLANETPTPDEAETWTELIPTAFAAVPLHALTPVEVAIMRLGKVRVALHISDVTDAQRARMKNLVLEHTQAMILGQREGTPGYLRSRLFDEFGILNRDFRRIAVTETGEACNAGFIAAQPLGMKVMRHAAYRGACEFCHSTDGKIYTVIAPDDPRTRETLPNDPYVWVGKTNIGRSASPRKREGDRLVEREPDEMWHCCAGVNHPHCRCSWTTVSDSLPVDQAFMDAMRKRHAAHLATVKGPRHDDAPDAA